MLEDAASTAYILLGNLFSNRSVQPTGVDTSRLLRNAYNGRPQVWASFLSAIGVHILVEAANLRSELGALSPGCCETDEHALHRSRHWGALR